MRSVAYSLLLLASAAVASPALAQENAPFTGFRAEGLLGYDRVETNPGRDNALMYGAGVGYDIQMRGLLVGVEGEIADSNAKSCAGSRTAVDPRLCVKSGRDLYAGARVGTVIGSSTLLYAKAGYTNARAQLNSDDGTTDTRLFKSDLDGVRVGAGAEYALSQNMFVKAEYRYSNYERDVERHQLVGGFGVRF